MKIQANMKKHENTLLRKNDIIELEIDAMSAEGSGIGRYEGMAVFVPQTAVGDRISCHILKVQKNLAFGKAEKILEPSADRETPDCSYFEKCGGCVYRHISYEAELEIKTARVMDALERIGGFKGLNIRPIIGAAGRCFYRNKAQIPVGLDRDGNLILGFYAGHSHRIIDAEKCLLQPEDFAVATDIFRQWYDEYGNPDMIYNEEKHRGLIRHIYLRKAAKTDELMFCLVINGENLRHSDKLLEMLRLNLPNLKGFILNINREKTNVILGSRSIVLWGDDFITDELCGLKFAISPLSFYQVNRDQAEKLYTQAAEYAGLTGKENLMDLYCGAGTIGLTMAGKAKKLIGVEIVEQAIENAKANASANGVRNAEFICGDAAKAAEVLAHRGEKPDVIVIDPPRKGCSPDLIHTIDDLSPERVVYVSCDPATLARDLKLFGELGWVIHEATPCDLFPGTAHVESVVLLTKVHK